MKISRGGQTPGPLDPPPWVCPWLHPCSDKKEGVSAASPLSLVAMTMRVVLTVVIERYRAICVDTNSVQRIRNQSERKRRGGADSGGGNPTRPTHTNTHTHTHRHQRTHPSKHTHVHEYTHRHTDTHIHTHTHTHTHTHK